MNKVARRGWMPLFIALMLIAATKFFYCTSRTSSAPVISETGTLTDTRDGKKYKTTVIGDKRWMAENLNYQPQGKSWCYEDSGSNCEKYGRLYDFHTAKAVCPTGWHLSSRRDWIDLLAAAGGKEDAGKALKAKRGWNRAESEKINGNGMDDYSFSALPGGARDNGDGEYDGVGENGAWWSDAERDSGEAFAWFMSYNNDKVFGDSTDSDDDDDDDIVTAVEKGHGFSVRCVQDGTVSAEEQREAERRRGKAVVYFTDSRDGRKYRIVDIGEQTWMAENVDYQPKEGNSWCYDNDKANCAVYGRLYDFNTAKSVCPKGWHLPDKQEWDTLALKAGGEKDSDEDGGDYWEDAGKRLKSRHGWSVWRSTSGNGSDRYGFSALPGGHRAAKKDDVFNNAGYYGYWWTATEYAGKYTAASRTMDYDKNGISESGSDIRYGFSVRCIQDESPEKVQKRIEAEQKRIAEEQKEIEEARKVMEAEQKRIEKLSTYFTDSRDGKKYRAVEIGGKTWMAENLNYTPPKDSGLCYKNSADSCKKYGRLYNWNIARTVCPAGWHLPTREEWGELGRAAGGERKTFENGTVDWYGAGKKLKSKTGWNTNTGVGTDDYGYSALPGGDVCLDCNPNGRFELAGVFGWWWTASERGDTAAYYHRMGYNRESGSADELVEYFENKAQVGLSVRCVQNAKK